MYMNILLLAVCLVMSSCSSIMTGRYKKQAGRLLEERQSTLFGKPVGSTYWEHVPSSYDKNMETIREPLRWINWALLAGLVLSAALCLTAQNVVVSARCLKIAIGCGIGTCVCWGLLLATASLVVLIPVLIGVLVLGYNYAKGRGILFKDKLD